MLITNSNTYKTFFSADEHVGHKCPICGDIGRKIHSEFVQDYDEHGVFGHRTLTCSACDTDWQEHYDMREIIIL